MSANNILPWRPNLTAPPSTLDPRVLWAVRKQHCQIDCILYGRDGDGWNLRVLVNGQWFFSCRFTSWAEAARAAGDKHAELLIGGWLPSAFSES